MTDRIKVTVEFRAAGKFQAHLNEAMKRPVNLNEAEKTVVTFNEANVIRVLS